MWVVISVAVCEGVGETTNHEFWVTLAAEQNLSGRSGAAHTCTGARHQGTSSLNRLLPEVRGPCCIRMLSVIFHEHHSILVVAVHHGVGNPSKMSLIFIL